HREDETTWEVLVGGKRVTAGKTLHLEDGLTVQVIAQLDGSRRRVRFSEPVEAYLERKGQMPLPPYIHVPLKDSQRYQTVYALTPGSAAAPTAGLHFTPELMERLRSQGIQFASVTLHVGLDTFAPVTEENPMWHPIHTEWCQVTPETAEQINAVRRQGGRIIAVGTTTVRTLETAAQATPPGMAVLPYSGATNLYILPGYFFKAVDAMITNFHLPRSTLLMLVSAFTGRERLMQVYQQAISSRYRFYSFGDAMLIL
ncbi:MAG: tRNA preQ1(34) S-adenosylmethionine ribosyltransferase-isomerase QueA, partial [Anaerolineae bacterium]|nr:tRNA preQ1(34) S-adenosylmethionine ribosyltransferase-isomerase QueA [Anaerolineae bacterium]